MEKSGYIENIQVNSAPLSVPAAEAPMKMIAPIPIPLVNDILFQYVFGEPEGMPLLKAMLNSFFEMAGTEKVSELQLQSPRLGPQGRGEKTSHLDILAKDVDGRFINIEIQTYRQDYYLERSLFYWSRVYSRQLGRGRNYNRLRPVISVNLLDVNCFKGDQWYTVDKMAHSEYLQIHTLELSKIAGRPSNSAESWGKFIETSGRNDSIARVLARDNRDILEAERRIEQFMGGIDRRFLRALAKEKAERDRISYLDYAKREGWENGVREGKEAGLAVGLAEGRTIGHTVGLAKGLAEGRTVGLAEGRTVGLAEGRTVGLEEGLTKGREKGATEKALEIARRLKARGLNAADIAEATGMSREAVEALRLPD